MYQTIQVSSRVFVQGEFIETLADGDVLIRDGRTVYRGRPVERRATQPSPQAVVSETASSF
jgi:hypothetical protein